MSVRLIAGDCRAVLAGLPENSVQMVCTSPPYFGLRSYSTEPQVWGGDSTCEHDWAHARYYVEGGGCAGGSGEAFSAPGQANADRIKRARWREDDTCRRCGAWRGELGAEPTVEQCVANIVAVFREVRRVLRPDGTLWLNLGTAFCSSRMESEEYVMRDELTDEERAYVYAELAKAATLSPMREADASAEQDVPLVSFGREGAARQLPDEGV